MTDRGPRETLLEVVARRRVVLDSAMGTRLIDRGLSLSDDDPALWNASNPDVVESLHRADLRAGSDAVLTNTFGANRDWLARFGKAAETRNLNGAGVALARGYSGGNHFVIGSIGPGFTQVDSVIEQAQILEEVGVDAILFETFPFRKAVEALAAVGPRVRTPFFVSLIDWDHIVCDQASQIEDLGASAIGANCITGLKRLEELASALRCFSVLPLLMKPSVGLPGHPAATPLDFRRLADRLFERGVRMVGGCCGTTEAHVAEIRKSC